MTAEEFIREKIREKQELRGEMQALWKYSVSGEDCLRWAHEYADLAALSPAIPESLEERQALKKAWSESSALPLVSPAKQEWVSVKERLPEHRQNVLVYIDTPYMKLIKVLFHDNGIWDDYNSTVTHWMPLPALPYTEENPMM